MLFFLFQSIFACVHWIRQVSTKHSCRQLCLGIDVAAVPRRESPRRVGVPQHHGHVDTRKKTPTKCHADCQEMQYMRQLSQHTQNNADRHSVKFVWYLICSPLVRSYAYGHPPPPSIRQWSCVSSAFRWQAEMVAFGDMWNGVGSSRRSAFLSQTKRDRRLQITT